MNRSDLEAPPPNVPNHIQALAHDAQQQWTARMGSPSESREVIADWCESQGLHMYAKALRPRPLGQHDVTWDRMRATVLRWLSADT